MMQAYLFKDVAKWQHKEVRKREGKRGGQRIGEIRRKGKTLILSSDTKTLNGIDETRHEAESTFITWVIKLWLWQICAAIRSLLVDRSFLCHKQDSVLYYKTTRINQDQWKKWEEHVNKNEKYADLGRDRMLSVLVCHSDDVMESLNTVRILDLTSPFSNLSRRLN